jgi:hypothetical protein
MVLLEPVLTTSLPVIVPEMMTIFLSSPATADLSAESEVTVTVEPPEPPEVLNEGSAKLWFKSRKESGLPAASGSIA